jgi:hypothetical protein
MMDIGEYLADIQKNCGRQYLPSVRSTEGDIALSILMNEAGYSQISMIKNDSIHIVTQ